jgi:SnoaL-like protein
MTTVASINLKALTEAIEADDPAAIAAAYAPDAVVEVLNRDHGPGDPIVLRGRDAVRTLLDDTASRKLSHRVDRAVADERSGALQVSCRYPDGVGVTCLSTFDLQDGQITRETRIEVWDG